MLLGFKPLIFHQRTCSWVYSRMGTWFCPWWSLHSLPMIITLLRNEVASAVLNAPAAPGVTVTCCTLALLPSAQPASPSSPPLPDVFLPGRSD